MLANKRLVSRLSAKSSQFYEKGCQEQTPPWAMDGPWARAGSAVGQMSSAETGERRLRDKRGSERKAQRELDLTSRGGRLRQASGARIAASGSARKHHSRVAGRFIEIRVIEEVEHLRAKL